MKSKISRIFLSFLTVLMVFISLPVMNASAEERETSDGIYYKISDGKVTITDYTGTAKNLIIPSSIDGYPVTSIGDWAFFDCDSLTSITIPSSVTSIGYGAFSTCDSLTSITIPEGVTSIGGYAFESCTSLTSITIPSSVTSIGDWAFVACSALKRMVVDKNNPVYDSRDNCNAIIETATNTLIAGCSKTEIPSSVTSIGDIAFDYCKSLTSITIPSSVTSIGSGAFNYCNSLSDVYYKGSEADWNKIIIGSDNEALTSADIHFAKQSTTSKPVTSKPSNQQQSTPKPTTPKPTETKPTETAPTGTDATETAPTGIDATATAPTGNDSQTTQMQTASSQNTSEKQGDEGVSTVAKIVGFSVIGVIIIAVVVLWVFIVKKIRKV